MSFLKDYDKAISSLKVKGKILQTVPRDGNCVYYSISDQLFGHWRYHSNLRAQAVAMMLTNHQYFIHCDWNGSEKDRSYQGFLAYVQN